MACSSITVHDPPPLAPPCGSPWQVACSECDKGYSSETGASACLSALPAFFFDPATSLAQPCPKEAQCLGSGDLPRPKPGYACVCLCVCGGGLLESS